MAQGNGDIMRLIDNLDRRHLTVAARPFISGAVAPGLSKEQRAELFLKHTEQERAIRDNWLAQQAEEAKATRAERLQIEEGLKLVKAAKEKQKMDKKQFDKEQKELAKEKAHVDKQEKRIKMLEDMARKRDEDREKAIEQAKKKAEKRAIAEQKREQETRERLDKVRRLVEERKKDALAKRELEVVTRQVYEERRKELAIQAELAQKEQEEILKEARATAELQARLVREAKEAEEQRQRDLRIANMQLAAEKKLAEIAARRAAREAREHEERLRQVGKQKERDQEQKQEITPPMFDSARQRATADWAASQTRPPISLAAIAPNPRLAAGHPNANPLAAQTAAALGNGLKGDQKAEPEDADMNEHINETLLRLVREAKERLKVEKEKVAQQQASKSGKAGTKSKQRANPSGSGLVKDPLRKSERLAADFRDRPLFASDAQDNDDNDDDLQPGYDDGALDDDSKRDPLSKRTFVTESPEAVSPKRTKAATGGKAGLAQEAAGSAQRPGIPSNLLKRNTLPSDTVLGVIENSKAFVHYMDDVYTVKPAVTSKDVYLSFDEGIPSFDMTAIKDPIMETHSAKPPQQATSSVEGSHQWQSNCVSFAIQLLAKKASLAGNNALTKLRVYNPEPQKDGSGKFDFLVWGVPATITPKKSGGKGNGLGGFYDGRAPDKRSGSRRDYFDDYYD